MSPGEDTQKAFGLASLRVWRGENLHSPLPQAGEGLGVRVVESTSDPLTPALSPMNGGEGAER
jgi:hypothetical protein